MTTPDNTPSDSPTFPSDLAVSNGPQVPVLTLRGTVAFPGPTFPITLRHLDSIKAVELALKKNGRVFVVTQHDSETSDAPTPALIGVLARIDQVQRGMGGMELLVTGLKRGQALQYTSGEQHRQAVVKPLASVEPSDPLETNFAALDQELRTRASQLARQRGLGDAEVRAILASVKDPGNFADLTAAHLEIDITEKQALLETLDVEGRMKKVLVHLQRQLDLQRSRQKIRDRVKDELNGRQKEMYLREQLKAIQSELGDSDDTDQVDELRAKLASLPLPKGVRSEVNRELKRLERSGPQSSEAAIIATYLEQITRLPWDKRSEETLNLRSAEHILAEDHWGLDDVKDRVLEHLSVRKLRREATADLPAGKSPILLLTGPPGVGKTSIAESVARSLGRQYVRIALGGVRDESDVRGHRRTYVGAMPGRIIEALQRARTNNPVIVLDEIDKLGESRQGDPGSALLEVLDPAQNHGFVDHYLNVPFDLSEVLFIATANRTDTIAPPLLDRMEVIPFSGYTEKEKLQIAKRYLLPKRLSESGLAQAAPELHIEDSALKRLIEGYTHESGVRQLNRKIEALLRRLARFSASGRALPPIVGERQIEPLLGRPKVHPEQIAERAEIGQATGMYFTPMGGDILFVEAALRPLQSNDIVSQRVTSPASEHTDVNSKWGHVSLKLTGQLGEVMKESAQAALTYATSRADALNLSARLLGPVEAHIHVPAGAIPKDGPSAGVTIATALISAMSGRAVRRDVAMTGEITLRGRVLPVGGIKEKVLGAHRAGVRAIVLPQRNAADLEDLPEEIVGSLQFHFADTLEDVLAVALEPPPKSVQFPPCKATG